MSYKALYRTYRPQTFNDVTGQDVVVQTLQNAIKNNKISHAYLFCGPRGTGKTSIARIFAKALNCSNLDVNEPCDECISCKEISQGINPDVIEIDAASNNGVDEIRDIREKVKYLPSGSKYKIYIIDEVHMLSGGAFNALLKTLEEPPKHVVFILATTEPQKLPATIVSRCQRYEFKSLGVEEISSRLKQICELEDVSITEEALNSISESAEGAMRDALSILDQAISYGNKNIEIDDINGVTGSLNFEKVIALGNAIENKDIHNTLEVTHELLSSGKEISKIINGLLVFYRDVLLYKSVGDSGYSKYIFEKEEFKEFSSKANVSKIMYLIDILCDIQSKVKFSTTPNIFLEIALIKMCNVSSDDLDVLKRLAELENKINNIGNIDLSNVVPVSNDNDKVNMIEAKLGQVITELNRLEIRKQIEKIDELKNIVNNMNSNGESSINREAINELNHLKNRVDELDLFVNKEESSTNDDLLVKIKELEQKLSNNIKESGAEVEFNLDDVYERLTKLEENQVIEIKNNHEVTENLNLDDIYNRLIILETSKLEAPDNIKVKDLEEDILALKDDLNQVKEQLIENQNSNYESNSENLDTAEISEKLMFLEKRIYQIVAGELSTKKHTKKEPKKNNGQIMLFGDEILGIADLEEKNKEKIDFEELQREEPLVVVKKDETVEEEVVEEFDGVLEQQEVKQQEVMQQEVKQQEVMQQEIDLQSIKTNEVLENNIQLFDSSEVEEKEVKDVIEQENNNNTLEEKEESAYFNVNVNTINDIKVIHTEKSNIVRMPKEDDKNYDITKNIINNEKNIVSGNMFNAEPVPEDGKDKFASYNVKFIEQILHDSRSIEARNDKVRIEQVWKNMTRGARPEQLSVIETLQSGMVAVVGNKEFIIAFPSVGLCNTVMRPKFKEVAIRILYNLLGDKYNYVALPNDIWSRVSAEYKGQYQMGTRYPTLSPLNIPGLEVIEDEYETESQKAINKTLRMFGQNNVKIE